MSRLFQNIIILSILSAVLPCFLYAQDIENATSTLVTGRVISISPEFGMIVINLGKKDGVIPGDELIIDTTIEKVSGWISYSMKTESDVIIPDMSKFKLVAPGNICRIIYSEEKTKLTLDILTAELLSSTPEMTSENLLNKLYKLTEDMDKLIESKVEFSGTLEVGGSYEEFGGIDYDNDTNGRASLTLEWEGEPNPTTRWSLEHKTEKSDLSFYDSIYGEYETKLNDRLDLETSLSLRLWDYTNDVIDDQITIDEEFALIYKINDKWSFEGGLDTFFLTEYDGRINNGYSLYKPYLSLEYEFSDFSDITLTYEYSDKNNRAHSDEGYDYTEDSITLDISCFTSKWYLYSDLEWVRRDYEKPDEEDDYDELSLYSYVSYYLNDEWTLGLNGNLEVRSYKITGASDTDYIDWYVSPSLTWLPVDWLSITLSSNYRHWQNRDRHSNDSRDKSLENFYEQGGEIYISWYPKPEMSFSLSHSYTVRRYPRGETGIFPYYSTDYSIIANRNENTSSANFNWDISDDWELQAGGYYSNQVYPNYPDEDNDYFSADISLAYNF